MTRKTSLYNNLLKLLEENLKNKNETFFTMEQSDFLQKMGVGEDKYNVDGKFKFSIFKRACLIPNLTKIKKEENISVLLTKNSSQGKMTLFFNVVRLLQGEEEKQSKESQYSISLHSEDQTTQEKEPQQPNPENSNINIPTPFYWLTKTKAQKLMYGLFKICPIDSKYFYEKILQLIKNKEEEIETILECIQNINEEYRILATNINEEKKVAIFVLEDEEEVHKFNIQIEEYENKFCNKIVPGEKYSLIATNEEGLKYYTILAKRLKVRVKWAEEDTFSELSTILNTTKIY